MFIFKIYIFKSIKMTKKKRKKNIYLECFIGRQFVELSVGLAPLLMIILYVNVYI